MRGQMENRVRIGLIGIAVAVSIVLATLQYEKLPFFRAGIEYSAQFADAGGLLAGDQVDVAGIKVGTVNKITLEDAKVLVRFSVDEQIKLGDHTSAAIKTNTVLGRKSLAVAPRVTAGCGAMTTSRSIGRPRPTRSTTPSAICPPRCTTWTPIS